MDRYLIHNRPRFGGLMGVVVQRPEGSTLQAVNGKCVKVSPLAGMDRDCSRKNIELILLPKHISCAANRLSALLAISQVEYYARQTG